MNASLVKAFSTDSSFGNPAGVILGADDLSDAKKQSIASALGFSESAFVESSNIADYRVRFFTPTEEVDFCGHATVATFYTLVQKGIIVVGAGKRVVATQETGIGVIPVSCLEDGCIMMTQKDPEFSEIFTGTSEIARMLGITPDELTEHPCQVMSTGARQLTVCVNNLDVLKKIKPNLAKISQHSKRYNHAGIAVITAGGFTSDGDLATRNFAPFFGIDEDPATGVAAGAIGWYADKYIFKGNKKKLIVEQGFEMGAASTIYVDITNKTLVGGYASHFGTADINSILAHSVW